MLKLVILILLCTVRLRRKSRKALFKYVNFQRLVASNQDIDSQIKLVAVDKQGICDIPRNNRHFIHIQLIQVLNNRNTSALRRISRLHNPRVTFWFSLLDFLEGGMEVVELIRQDVGIRGEVELLPAEFILHFDKVVAETVLSSDLVTHRKVIDALVLVQAFIEETLAGAARPEDIPLM